MAAAKFACPACQTVLQLSQAPPIGAKIRCPKCQAVFAVRAPAPKPVITAQTAVAVGSSASHAPAKVGGSSLKMRGNAPAGAPAAAPMPGRSSMKIKAAAPPPPPPPVDEEEYEVAPTRKPKKKKNREATLIAVFAGLGALLVVIVVVVVLVIMFRPATNDADQIRADFERAQQRSRSQTRPTTARGNNPAPARADTAPSDGGPSSEAPPPSDSPDRPVASDGSGGNPFANLNVGNLPARAPRELDTLRFLPDRAETVMFADFDAVKGQPAVAALLMNLFVTPDLGDTHPLAQMGKLTPPAKLDYVLSSARFGNLAAAMTNPAQAGAAVEFTTVLFHLRSKVEQGRLVRALRAEEGPHIGGFICHRLPLVEQGGAKFHGFLLFPEADDRTVVVALSLKDDAVALVGSGSGMNLTMQGVLTAIEPSHFWSATSLESFKPLLSMATMAAGANMPPELAGELKPILAELPNARGFFVQTRLVDNVMRATVALTFETQGPGGTMSTNLSSLWNGKIKQVVQAAGANSKIAGDIARSLRVAVRGTAVNVNIQITTAALAGDYPMIAQALRSLPAMTGTLTAGASAGSPGPSGAEVPPSPGQTPPPSTTSEPMTPTDGGGTPSTTTTPARSRSNPNAPIGLEVNLRAPDIEGNDAEGKRFKLSNYKGKVIVLDFWGYWCPPCRSMLPHERDLVERLQNEPFVFLGVNTDLRNRFNQERPKDPVTWRNFMDGQRGPICQKYKIEAYPTLFLIDGNMVIRHKFVGVPPNAVLDKAIDELIAELKGR